MTEPVEPSRPQATVLDGADELRAAVGTHLGSSGWLPVDQARVERFLEATGGPVGGDRTTVPPHLLLALSNHFLPRIVDVRGFAVGVNYGTGPVRFPAPLATGAEVRAGVELQAVDEVTGGVQTTTVVTMETRTGSPVCVVHAISRYLR